MHGAPVGHPGDRAAKESGVEKSGGVFYARTRVADERHCTSREPDADYPVSEFLKRVGTVFATCLGLALLAHVLVVIVGAD
jgi:hypothetical protein